MDEIGLIVTHVDEKGFVRFTRVGIPLRGTMLGGRVRFINGVQGVIGSEHSDRINEIPPAEKFYIDVGASGPKDCPVNVGDVAAFDRPLITLGKRLAAKAMDDRAGVLVAIESMRRLAGRPARAGEQGSGPNEVFFVFTVQEEAGKRGATVSAYGIDPEVGLAIDVTPTGDTPGAVQRDIALGKGPTIKVKDASMLADPRVVEWMSRTAEKNRISIQREVLAGASTDARAIQLTRAGVLAGGLGIPCRYVHTPSEMVDIDDLENAIALLTALLSKPVGI
jgi:endoglucanase